MAVKKIPEYMVTLNRAGMSTASVWNLRRIAMALHRWHELECGTDIGGIERDEATGKVTFYNARTGHRSPHPDHETPALLRLKAVMAEYPGLGYYIQTDPRGAPIYVIRPGDIPEDETVDAYYNRGVAVY